LAVAVAETKAPVTHCAAQVLIMQKLPDVTQHQRLAHLADATRMQRFTLIVVSSQTRCYCNHAIAARTTAVPFVLSRHRRRAIRQHTSTFSALLPKCTRCDVCRGERPSSVFSAQTMNERPSAA
jgi:hypothetical protein